MAKKKSKKSSNVAFIINLIVILIGVLTLCTLFMPVFNIDNIVGEVLDYSIKGSDVISGAFASEVTKEMSAGAAKIYALRNMEEISFIANVFSWGYIFALVLACASIVFAVLKLLNMKFKMANVVIGGLLAFIAVVTFIFAIVLSSKYASINTVFESVTSKAVINFGVYLLLLTLVGGLGQVYIATKK